MGMQTVHMQDGKGKRSKRWKTEVKAEVVESIGENQPDWLDTLKEEIANLK
jgi:peroxiredoxin